MPGYPHTKRMRQGSPNVRDCDPVSRPCTLRIRWFLHHCECTDSTTDLIQSNQDSIHHSRRESPRSPCALCRCMRRLLLRCLLTLAALIGGRTQTRPLESAFEAEPCGWIYIDLPLSHRSRRSRVAHFDRRFTPFICHKPSEASPCTRVHTVDPSAS